MPKRTSDGFIFIPVRKKLTIWLVLRQCDIGTSDFDVTYLLHDEVTV